MIDTRSPLFSLPLGLVAALVAGAGGAAAGLATPAAATLGLTLLCAIWWVLEPVPIAVTGLVPLAVLPFLGVLPEKEVAAAYGHPLILLLLGGLIISAGLESSRAHRRLALHMVRLVGGRSRRRLVLGFMLASAGLSMWISNTATTLMLMPVALAVLEDEAPELATPLLLGIAYGASIGGLGTPVGTPPNVLFIAQYLDLTGEDFSFLRWMGIGVPVVILLLPVAWWVLTRDLRGSGPVDIPAPGPWRPAERRVLVLFALTALAWVTRSEPLGGWSGLLGVETVGDSTVALASAVAMLVLPSGELDDEGKSPRLLAWSTAQRVPWGLLLLFAGGLALAKAFQASGLSAALGQALAGLAALPLLLVMLTLCLGVSFLTEVTSNTATSAVLLPVLAAAAQQASIPPEILMIPAVLSASCAFMLPVATAPNAIVFASGHISGRQMARTGVALNLVGAVIVSLVCYALLG